MELVNGKTLVTLALIFIPWLQVETKSITCYQSSQRRIGSECGNCPSCDPGYGLSERCGYGAGENATCQPCIDGKTYNKRNRARECSGCFDCNSINRVVKRCCRVVINAVCGGCKDGYYDKHAEAGYWDKDLYELPCFPCSETKPDHPSCASYWSKRLTTPQPDREAADKTNHYKVNITDMKLEQRKGASFSYEHAVHVLIGVLCVAVLMVLLLLAFVIWNWKKLRQIDCGESGSPNPTYSGSNPECVNLAREPSSDDTEHETGGDPAGGVNEDGLDAGEKSPLLTPSKSTKMRQKSSSSLGSMNHGSEKMNKDNQNKNLFKCKPDLFRTLSDPLGSQTDLIAETKSKKDCIHAAKLRAEQSNWKAKIKSEVLQGATPDHPNISTGQSSTEVASSEDTVFDGNVSEPVNNVDVSLNRAPEVGAIGFHAYPPKSYTPSSSNLELKSLDDSNVSASLSDTPVNSLSEVSTLIIPGRNQNGYQDSEPNKHPSKNQTTSPISYIKTQIPPQCGNKLPIDCTDKRVPDQKVNNLNFGELNTAKNELRTSDMTATSFTDTASISVTANEAKMMDFGDVANTRSSQVTLPLEKDLLLNPLKYPKEKQTEKNKENEKGDKQKESQMKDGDIEIYEEALRLATGKPVTAIDIDTREDLLFQTLDPEKRGISNWRKVAHKVGLEEQKIDNLKGMKDVFELLKTLRKTIDELLKAIHDAERFDVLNKLSKWIIKNYKDSTNENSVSNSMTTLVTQDTGDSNSSQGPSYHILVS